MNEIVIFEDDRVSLRASVDEDTIWLNQKQLCELYGRDKSVISRHIRNIFKEKELDAESVVAKNATTASDGKTYMVDYYNLDMIISLGYRVNSKRATQFRQWATRVLRQHLLKGYTLDQKRLDVLEEKQAVMSQKLDKVIKAIEDESPQPSQGIFFDGQIFDAHVFVSDLIKSARSSIILIDNYIDESVLTLFTKNQNIDVMIYTHTISKRLKLDLQKYNAQYRPIQIKTLKSSHDRFLILDRQTIYHIGASLKDLGRRWFAFSKMETRSIELLERLG